MIAGRGALRQAPGGAAEGGKEGCGGEMEEAKGKRVKRAADLRECCRRGKK